MYAGGSSGTTGPGAGLRDPPGKAVRRPRPPGRDSAGAAGHPSCASIRRSQSMKAAAAGESGRSGAGTAAKPSAKRWKPHGATRRRPAARSSRTSTCSTRAMPRPDRAASMHRPLCGKAVSRSAATPRPVAASRPARNAACIRGGSGSRRRGARPPPGPGSRGRRPPRRPRRRGGSPVPRRGSDGRGGPSSAPGRPRRRGSPGPRSSRGGPAPSAARGRSPPAAAPASASRRSPAGEVDGGALTGIAQAPVAPLQLVERPRHHAPERRAGGVRRRPVPAFSNRAVPAWSWSARTWRDTAPWVRPSSSAAFVTEPRRAAASKARKEERGAAGAWAKGWAEGLGGGLWWHL